MQKAHCAGPYIPSIQVNSALHPSGVAKSSTSFGRGKGGNVTSAGWQVTLCDPVWHVSSRSGVATLRTAIHLLLTYSTPGGGVTANGNKLNECQLSQKDPRDALSDTFIVVLYTNEGVRSV